MVSAGGPDVARNGAPPRALLISGTVGVGKTTVAAAVSNLLEQMQLPNALIDVDALRQAWPPPPQDPFNMRLALCNLTSVAANYVEAGMTNLILAGVIESPSERRAFEAALGMPLVVCLLQGDPAAIRARLVHRHHEDEAALAWHLNRAPELAAILDSRAVSDYFMNASSAAPSELAAQITRAIGWCA